MCPCGNRITGKKIKWCSNVCSIKNRRVLQQKRYEKYHPKLPTRKCIFCDKIFFPRQDNHECCTRRCRERLSLYKLREKNKFKPKSPLIKKKWGSHGFIYKNNEPRIIKTKKGLDTSNSDHQKEIEKYIKSGGAVKTLSPEIDGKIPGASMQNQLIDNWNIDDLMGFGYSNRFMEEVVRQQSQGGFDVD